MLENIYLFICNTIYDTEVQVHTSSDVCYHTTPTTCSPIALFHGSPPQYSHSILSTLSSSPDSISSTVNIQLYKEEFQVWTMLYFGL